MSASSSFDWFSSSITVAVDPLGSSVLAKSVRVTAPALEGSVAMLQAPEGGHPVVFGAEFTSAVVNVQRFPCGSNATPAKSKARGEAGFLGNSEWRQVWPPYSRSPMDFGAAPAPLLAPMPS